MVLANGWKISNTFRSFDPSDIETALWLDAADASTVTLNGSTVSQWRDKSGNSRHASQATPASQPTYAAAGFNAKPTIQFDGVNDELNLVQFAQASNQHIFAVVDTTNIGTGYSVLLNRAGDFTHPAVYLGGSANYQPMLYWNGGDRAAWSTAVQRKAIICWSFATGTPASALTQVDGQTAVTQTFAASNLASWSRINTATAQQSDVDISELIVTPTTPSTSERQKIEGYLAHKWGLTANLPASHPYKTVKPTP